MVGGFSGGGLTAWEIARQLEGLGEAVALTVLLDTPVPVRPPLSRLDKMLIRLQEMREQGPAFAANWVRAKLAHRAARRARAEAAPAETHQFHDTEIEAAFIRAVGAYEMPRRDGRTVLFRPPLERRYRVSGGRFVSSVRHYVHHDNELAPYAPALEVVEVPGDHDSMVLEPNVRVLARRLRAAIEAAEAPAPAWRAAAE